MYTRKRRSFKVTPGKLEELQERLVEMRGTPAKGGETPEKRGEPKPDNSSISSILYNEHQILHNMCYNKYIKLFFSTMMQVCKKIISLIVKSELFSDADRLHKYDSQEKVC